MYMIRTINCVKITVGLLTTVRIVYCFITSIHADLLFIVVCIFNGSYICGYLISPVLLGLNILIKIINPNCGCHCLIILRFLVSMGTRYVCLLMC